jgi:hypothetical protein
MANHLLAEIPPFLLRPTMEARYRLTAVIGIAQAELPPKPENFSPIAQIAELLALALAAC